MLPQRERSPGGHSGGETPGTIPNPEVKPSSADDTAWGTGRESRTLPGVEGRRAISGLFCIHRHFLGERYEGDSAF
jgi:hypothetical protein